MLGYEKFSLREMLEELGEEKVCSILSEFSCPMNQDVEYFLKKKAIEFEKHRWSATQLIYTSYKNAPVLIGYYSLANKTLVIDNQQISKSLRKRITSFSTYDPKIKRRFISAPLIGQLGKNFSRGYNKLVTGDELLRMALDDVETIQMLLGGKIVYLECEDKPCLVDFYSRNGFVMFDRRTLDKDETNISGEYLLQMLKVLK